MCTSNPFPSRYGYFQLSNFDRIIEDIEYLGHIRQRPVQSLAPSCLQIVMRVTVRKQITTFFDEELRRVE